MVLFLGICLFSLIQHGFINKSLSVFINIFLGCMDIYILAAYSRDIRKCINWLIIGLGINTIVFIGQKIGYSPIIDPKSMVGVKGAVWDVIRGQEGGIIGNAPRFAAFIALALPFAKRWYIIPAAILGFFLKEVSIFISILVILDYEARCFGKIFVWVALAVIAIGLAAVFHRPLWTSMISRIDIWKQMIDHIAARPVAGMGLGVFKIADFGMSSSLQWVYGVGISGIAFIVLCLRRLKWYLIPLVFLCCVEYPFEIPRLYPVIIFTVAYYATQQKEEIRWV